MEDWVRDWPLGPEARRKLRKNSTEIKKIQNDKVLKHLLVLKDIL